MTAILSVRGLEKSFGSVVAARNINVAVPYLQTVGIIGANGSGKTTFVNMITGHLRPSKGSIWFEDRDITGRPSREISRLGIARSFQVPQIFNSLSVLDNICTATAIARTGGRLMRQALTPFYSPATRTEGEAALRLFRIANYHDARAAALPQGVRKLLDIAMAAAGQPRVLLLDEPTSGISIEEKFGLMDVVMSALRDRRITVLFIEHDMDIVGRYADRVLAFHDGAVIADGAPAATLTNPRIQQLISGPKLKAATADCDHA
jgi:branched-chain amino acid transport system ATP-binding protein